MKKYFILSDIHAQYDLLLDALEEKGFDFENRDHVIIIAGDVLDRGRQGDKVIRFLESLIDENRILGVRGNHDHFLIEILEHDINMDTIVWNATHNGFVTTLLLGVDGTDLELKYNINCMRHIRKNLIDKYPVFCKWLLKLPLYLEFRNHVIVHAFLNFALDDWHDTDLHFAIWERRYNELLPDDFNKKLIFGHTPNYHINGQNDIIVKGKRIMIDGGAASGLQINILTLNEDEI